MFNIVYYVFIQFNITIQHTSTHRQLLKLNIKRLIEMNSIFHVFIYFTVFKNEILIVVYTFPINRENEIAAFAFMILSDNYVGLENYKLCVT